MTHDALHDRRQRLGLAAVYDKVLAGRRLEREDGLALFACPDITAVGELAHLVRTRRHGKRTYYVCNQHVNYTNVCVNKCAFCAFHRERGEEGSFVLSPEDMANKLAANPSPPREAHIVGGCHPELGLDYFVEGLRRIRSLLPHAVLKCFTAVEIAHFAKLEQTSTAQVLQTLKNAGLGMLPGGGAEIFAPDVRQRICPRKIDADEWLRIHAEAHSLGIQSNCTMLFGHVETVADRVDHLLRLRNAQDASGGFVCFIPLPFQTEHSALKISRPSTGVDELKTIAVSRLLLDNIPHIKAYWVMLTVKAAQAALYFGADDLDGVVVEEKIGHMAGAESEQALTRDELEIMIRGSGFEPVERDGCFQPVHTLLQEASAEEMLPPAMQPVAGRLDFEAAMELYAADLHTLGRLAHETRRQLHPEPIVTYVSDRNINYTNICQCGCLFCAYFRPPGHPDGYVISRAELHAKIEETLALGGTQILMQGGCHPELRLEWYEELLRDIRSSFPELHIHAFSPTEIDHLARMEELDTAETLRRLREAGLHSMPGGGAEILVDEVRERVSPNKSSAGKWLEIMEEAHSMGLRTTATMMFGHAESAADRVRHLLALRDLQDRTGGFTAFIPWTFQPKNTALSSRPFTAPEYLRLLALSRLVLDNIPNIQVSWVTMGPKVAQLALYFGGNDFGSTMIEENVVKAAGVSFRLSHEAIENIIRRAGFAPVQRRMDYTPVTRSNANG